MKKLSRVLAVILALALCLPGMAAAEMTEAEKLAEMVANVVLPTPELPLVDEPMTITVKYPKTSNHGDFDNCFYLKAVEKLTNIKLDVQGIDANGDITTLGRGGSDTTAVALAVFLHADLCQIYTDVDGVYDKDPRLYPDAMKFDWISYEKMRRLIAGGAQVLHDRSVELAQRFGLAIEVLSSFTGQPGTIVCAEESGT